MIFTFIVSGSLSLAESLVELARTVACGGRVVHLQAP